MLGLGVSGACRGTAPPLAGRDWLLKADADIGGRVLSDETLNK